VQTGDRERLVRGLERFGIRPGEELVNKLERYTELVLNWNRRINLVSRKDEDRFVVRHILDSIGPAAVIRERGIGRMMDVGTGAGLPGIPLYVVLGGPEMVLLEPVRKKTLFLGEVVGILGLEKVEVVRARLEDYRVDARFRWVVVRGLKVTAKMVEGVRRVLEPGGYLLRYVGGVRGDGGVPEGFAVEDVMMVEIEGIGRRFYQVLASVSRET